MSIIRSFVRRMHLILAMPDYVMGVDAPQTISSTPIWETRSVTE